MDNREKVSLIESGSAKSISTEKVLEVKDLRISFRTDNGKVQAVRGVSFELHKGETLCIVGESGSGKSVTSKAIMGILSANAIVEGGQIVYQGEDLLKVSEDEFHRIRGHKIGMIFQDPLSSLNPIMKIGKQITETMLINKDQLKNRYEDLIAPELTAYKNAKVIKNTTISYSLSSMNSKIADMKDDLKAREDLACKDFTSKIQEAQIVDQAEAEAKSVKISYDNQINKFTSKVSSISEKLSAEKAKPDVKKETVEKLEKDLAFNQSELKIHKSELEAKLDELIKDRNAAAGLIGIPAIASFDQGSSGVSTSQIIKEQSEKVNQVLSTFANDELAIKNKSAELLAEHKKVIVEANAKYKADLPALKLALKNKKIEAKEDNAKYAEKLKSERDSALAKLEEEKPKVVFSDETKAAIANIDSEIKKIKTKYNSLIALHYLSMKKKVPLREARDSKIDMLEQEKHKLRKALDDIEARENEVKLDYLKKTKITKTEARRHALEVMKEVGIPQAEQRFNQYPFQFSGGMRQRIVIAIALTAAPDILICDEPTTALDVTIQAQILELINNLKKERNLSCIFITHDLGVVANMADRVAVMYAGKICEYGTDKEIFFDPRHPYTWALLSSIPDIDSKEKLEAIPGTPPDMIYPPVGDAFAARNKYAMAIDFKYQPPYFKISDTHYAATWLLYKDAPKVDPPKIVTTRINKALEEEVKHENN